jgi:UDP-N-acetylglucosamine 1-carboxyvinyltransferase
VEVLERFGARVSTAGGLHARAADLRGCEIDVLDFSTDPARLRGPRTSSATKTALILAAVAEGRTTLRHPGNHEATRELRDFLRACGATITGAGDVWHVEAGAAAGDREVPYRLISDSTGILTYAACAAHVGCLLQITNITGDRTRPAIREELRAMEEMGVPLTWGPNDETLSVGWAEDIRPIELDVECNGFSTDAHPLFVVPLLRARGVSRITEHVWEDRFAYARLLTEMGARLAVRDSTLEIHPSELRPPSAPLTPTDSRAAAVAILAALGVHGTTTVLDAGHLDRSYETFVERLRSAGAWIEEAPSSDGV